MWMQLEAEAESWQSREIEDDMSRDLVLQNEVEKIKNVLKHSSC